MPNEERGDDVMKAATDNSLGDGRYQQLVEAAPDAILEVDRTGLIRLANLEAENLFRCSRADLLGKPVEQFVPGRFRNGHTADRDRYNAHPSKRAMGSGLDLWALRADGTEVPVDINLSPITVGEEVRIMCVVRDITDRKRAEEEIRALNQTLEHRNSEVERASQLKSEFLASMSHELRTPLNAIIGFSDLLAEQSAGDLNDKQMRYTGHIGQGARHLLNLINDILDLSKIEAGRVELRIETFPAADAIDEVLTAIRPIADKKKLILQADISPALKISADRTQFKQILYNLLSNAVKFTPEDGRVEIAAHAEANLSRIRVTDTGIGIAFEDTETIFESFRQIAATTKGVREGTGLGLAITKRLVEAHRGRIWVESQPGQGSSFFVELPARQERRGAEEATAAHGASTAPRPKPLVLIVEDDEPAKELLATYLESEGYEAAWATTGADALEQAARLAPDAITLDLLLPDGNGLKTLHQLKSDPATAHIPVIVVSILDERGMGFALGAAEYLTKPVEKEKLVAAVRKLIPASKSEPRVLVIDDNVETRDLLAAILEAEGYGPLLAASATEAFEILGRIRPDAILLDLLMPEMDGFELLARIKQDQSFRDLPVLILTAKSLTDQDLRKLAGKTHGIFLKGSTWKEALLDQLRLAVHET